MDFTLLGKPMTISEGRKNYLKILRDFQIMGKQAEADFRAEYDDRFGLVIFNSSYAEKFINTYGKCDSMDKLVKQYVSKARQYLMGYGVYTLTDEAIWNEAIITEDRSVSRSQYEFNSFFVDCLDSEQSDDVVVPRIKSKFEGSFFPTCLYNDVMALFDYVVGYLDDNKIADIQFVYKKDAEQAKAVYQNLKDTIITDEKMVNIMSSIPPGLSEEEFIAECERRQGPKIPQEEKARLAFSLIDLDPRKEEYFHLIFDEFPHARYEIAAIAQYLNMDMSNKIARDLSLRFDPNRVTNEEQALQMLKALQDAMDKYGQKTCAQKDALVKLLQDFDVKARTYGGILYETREQKAQAESDDRKMQEMCGNLSSLDKASCQLLVEQVSNCECIDEIKKKHISLINKRVDEIDSEHLDRLIIDLSSMDEAACNRLTEEINAYPASEHLKTAYTNKVAARIKEIWEAEDFERYVEIYQATPVGDSAAVGRSCSQIKQIGRTELKEKFVNALYFLNENEVAAAAKYIVSKEGNAISALLNSGKKASYDILTLDGRVMHPGIEGAVAALREKKSGGFLSGLMGKRTTAASHSAAPAVAGSRFCPNCGNKLEQSAKFCPSCGAKQN